MTRMRFSTSNEISRSRMILRRVIVREETVIVIEEDKFSQLGRVIACKDERITTIRVDNYEGNCSNPLG